MRECKKCAHIQYELDHKLHNFIYRKLVQATPIKPVYILSRLKENRAENKRNYEGKILHVKQFHHRKL